MLHLDRVDDPAQHHARKSLYIAEGKDDEVLSFLARELRARGVSAERVAEAFHAFVDAYTQARPTLAAFGIVHEDPSRTSAVGEYLMAGVQD